MPGAISLHRRLPGGQSELRGLLHIDDLGRRLHRAQPVDEAGGVLQRGEAVEGGVKLAPVRGW